MARMFRGESVHKVDGKGRVSIPAGFRRVLEDSDPSWTKDTNPRLVIVYGDRRRDYLECYTMAAMAEVDEKIAALPRGSVARRKLETLFTAQAHETSVDETGRLVLPAKLREKISVSDSAYFIAAGDTFQILSPDAYDAKMGELDDWLDDLDDDVDPLTLLDSGGGA
ncbi:MAG: division/cell wall cluster transcriptional repressor MraZ [Dinoroseobacter sp.]|nr:division/cell wall cluster transcriptional repressor MraZ [Dinoroseobacter sp.]MDJ0992381.1 division/cell wall cluster transcriptional repressor MraZ [Dinoroseobacter sp.]